MTQNLHRPGGRTLPILLVLVAALSAGIGLWAGQRWFGNAGSAAPQFAALRQFPSPRVLADFALTRADGSQASLSDWKGQWNLVFFGFTHCPDVCPQALALLRDALQMLRDRGISALPKVTFISVDPERDSGKPLGDYATYFDPTFAAWTGSHEQLAALSRQLGVVYARVALEGSTDAYTVDHSGSVLVVDPEGRLAGVFMQPLSAQAIADDAALLPGVR